MNQETKICQNCQKEFTVEPEDFEFYEKIKVPTPTFCPECRMIRRMCFRNEHFLYKRKDSLTGEIIFSTFSELSPIKVYKKDYWWSDQWDPMDYGQDYNWNKSFFEQFRELSLEVPWFSRSIMNLVNSDYCANASDLKNCYLLFDSGPDTENCAYGAMVNYSKDSFDNYQLHSSELCYDCFMVYKSYRIFFSAHCYNCQDVYFSQNLNNCQNCFACVNLRNRQYYIFNQPYLKKEYFQKLKKFNIGSYKNTLEFIQKLKEFQSKFIYKNMHGKKNINVNGDYINYSKNVSNSFMINNAEGCKYCFNLNVGPVKDSYEYNGWGENAELIYESNQTGNNIFRLKFCFMCYPNDYDLEYCIMCVSSSNLFGCVGLRHKQYCILNKQYTKEEYEELVPKIIEHMNSMPYIDKKGRVYKYGEFFPPELSPFVYNETIAQEYFPLTKEQAIEKGYQWKEPEVRNFQIDIKTQDLPDNIKDVHDDILGKIIECANAKSQNSALSNCTTAFKIIDSELEFYKKMNLPLPRLCPNCRHYERIQQRNPLKLWKRKCQCDGTHSSNGIYKNTIEHFHGNNPCPNEFETTYAPDRPEIVYCEKCYQSEVV